MSLGVGEWLMEKDCILDWKLTLFLVDCGKNIIRESQVRIIFQLFLSIVEDRGLAVQDSQDIIVCDSLMEKLVGMPHCHLLQLRDCVLSLLSIKETGHRVMNPTDDYKGMIHRIFPVFPAASNTAPPVPTSQVRWVMDENLSLFLVGFVSTQPVEYNFILTLITSYISNNRDRLLHPKNMEIAMIRMDGLYNIFGCSYIHKSQMRGLLRDHISPVDVS